MAVPKNHGEIVGPVEMLFYDGVHRGAGTWAWRHRASGLTFDIPDSYRRRQGYREALARARMFANDQHSAWTNPTPTRDELAHIDTMRRKEIAS